LKKLIIKQENKPVTKNEPPININKHVSETPNLREGNKRDQVQEKKIEDLKREDPYKRAAELHKVEENRKSEEHQSK
jgi:hypothetical protein